MRHTRRSAAKKSCDNARGDNENVANTTATTTLPKSTKRTLASIDTLEPNLPLVAQASVVNPSAKKARKVTNVAHEEQPIRTNEGFGDRERQGQLAPIDNKRKRSKVPQRSSSSFHISHDSSSSATHIPGPLNTISDQSDTSEVEGEEDWYSNPQDVPGAPTASKVSKATNDERPSWQELVVHPEPTLSPLSAGDRTEVDDTDNTQLGNSSGVTNTGLTIATQPTWPIETELVYITGTNRVKLGLQSRLLQTIFHDAFENIRRDLLFEHAFPDAIAIPTVVRKALVSAAEMNMFRHGHYNPSAAAVHQRLLSHPDYEAQMIRLPRARIPIYRGEVKERCAQLVYVEFSSIESHVEILRNVDNQLSNYTYTLPIITTGGVRGLPMRSKPYRNRRIITVIRSLFFSGGTSAYAQRYDSKFPRSTDPEGAIVREMSNAMLALVATALYAAIREWRTGIHQPADFSTDAYLDAYDGHVNTLKHLSVERPSAYHLMMRELYNLASAPVGVSSASPMTPIAPFNLDELE